MNWQFERVAGHYQGPTVGVAWDGEAVHFTVPNEGYVYRLDPATNATSEYRRFMRRIAGIGFAPDGDFFACQEGSRRIVQFQKDGSTRTTVSFFDGVIHNHPNDLCVDKLGRVWFSDAYNPVPPIGIYRPPLPHASVLRLERDNNRAWRIVRITQDTVAPRAVLLSADEKTLYLSEGDAGGSRHCELRAYPVRADGNVGDCVSLVTFGRDDRGTHRGIEGMCLDAEGTLVAVCGSRQCGPGPLVMVIAPNGQVIELHSLPFDLPMRCAFGGADMASLFVTSGYGGVYRAKSGRKGLQRK